MFRKMPFLLLALIILFLTLDTYIPVTIKQFLYAMSLTIKSGIIMVLPFIIFSLLFKTMVTLANRATAIILLIITCVVLSNTLTTFLSHFVGEFVYHFDLSLIKPKESDGLLPLFLFNFPKLIGNEKMMFAGIIYGIFAVNVTPHFAKRLAHSLDLLVDKLLFVIVCLIPLFVIGFVVKLAADGVLYTLVKDYSRILMVIACAQFGYISLLYLLLNRFSLERALVAIRNMLPAAITGFSTMSSAAAMPLTITGSEANATHKEIAGATIPATVNIHLMGDCFAITIFAYAVMKSFAFAEPSFAAFLVYLVYFVLAKFSVAAVPGGGILVMLPILESHLGFTTPMLSLMTALYVLFDPVITAANVFGNGAFSLLIDKLCGLLPTKRSNSL